MVTKWLLVVIFSHWTVSGVQIKTLSLLYIGFNNIYHKFVLSVTEEHVYILLKN